jgi:hypothetical protein
VSRIALKGPSVSFNPSFYHDFPTQIWSFHLQYTYPNCFLFLKPTLWFIRRILFGLRTLYIWTLYVQGDPPRAARAGDARAPVRQARIPPPLRCGQPVGVRKSPLSSVYYMSFYHDRPTPNLVFPPLYTLTGSFFVQNLTVSLWFIRFI